jgi:hypothetical protein
MKTPHLVILVVVCFLAGALVATLGFCSDRTDVNWDGQVNVLDVQLVVNDILGE